MRRTSSRKIVSDTQSKLFKSTNQLHEHVNTLLLEMLEDRCLFSTLPTPTVGLQQVIQNGGQNENDSTPSIAVDYNNPKILAAVWQTNNTTLREPMGVGIAYSLDGGKNWNTDGGVDVLTDPGSSSDNPQPFTVVSDPSVQFDRKDQAYIVWREASSDGNDGAILMEKLDFSAGSPTQVTGINPDPGASDPDVNVAYEWEGGDAAIQPVLAVDNNVATGTTATDSNSVTANEDDPYSGNVYIAWTTVDNSVTGSKDNTNFNPNEVRLITSSDGGNTFSTPIVMTPGNHSNVKQNYGAPSLVVSQGSFDGTVKPGQVDLVYDNFGSGHTTTGDVIDYTTATDANTDPTGIVGGTFYPDSSSLPALIQPNASNTSPTGVQTILPINIDPTKIANFDTLTDIEVNLSITHPSPQELMIQIKDPQGDILTLMRNAEDASGATSNTVGVNGGNMGLSPNNTPIGITFDDDAEIKINNRNVNTRFDYFLPEGDGVGGDPQTLRKAFAGKTAAQLTGQWQIIITDFRDFGSANPPPAIIDASIRMTSLAAPATAGGGDISQVATTGVHETAGVPLGQGNNPAPLDTQLNPQGIGPDPVIASDNTIGANSLYQGRLYVAYVGKDTDPGYSTGSGAADSTKVFLDTSDDAGQSWDDRTTTDPTDGAALNEPVAPDSEYETGTGGPGRPQLEPQIQVDPATGTVVISYLDTVDDASQTRPAYYVVTSIDGGTTFNTPTYVDEPQEATDAITGQTVAIGPEPVNESSSYPNQDNTYGFGDHQGLAVYDGSIFPIWSTNLDGLTEDAPGTANYGKGPLEIESVVATTAAGPRIVSGTQGVVGQSGDNLNNTTTADGTPIAKSFIVQFDRPIDPKSFTINDAKVYFRSAEGTSPTTGSQPGVLVPVTMVTPLDAIMSENDDTLGGSTWEIGATTFRVDFTPSSGVGTYMYSVGAYRDALNPSEDDNGPHDDIETFVQKITPDGGQVGPFKATGAQTNVTIADAKFDTTTTDEIDTTPTVSTLNIPSNQLPAGDVLDDLTVNLSLQHPADSDLLIALEAPDGTAVLLSDNNGGATGANYTNTTFDDLAPTTIDNGTAPFTGTFSPESSAEKVFEASFVTQLSTLGIGLSQGLSSFQGIDPTGQWTLIAIDQNPGPVGTQKILNWSLTLQGGTVSTTSAPSPGNLMDQNANGVSGEWDGSTTFAPTRDSNNQLSALDETRIDDTFQMPDGNDGDLPLIVPGPHIISAQIANNSTTVVNGTASFVDVTFDRDMDPTAFTNPDVLGITGPDGAVAGPFSVALAPTSTYPTNTAHPRTFRISFPTQTVSGEYSIELGKNIYAKNDLDQVDNNLNAGLDAIRNSATKTTPITYTSTDSPQIGGSTTNIVTKSTITISDDYPVETGMTLALNIAYASDPDLEAFLISPPTPQNPNGVTVKLFTNVGNTGTKANFTNTVFQDSGTPISSGGPPFQTGSTGNTFAPQLPFSTFTTAGPGGTPISVKGVWTLEIKDDKSGKTGTLNSWSLTFQKPLPNGGLGEDVADRSTVNFTIFTMDQTNSLSHSEWTNLGPNGDTTDDEGVEQQASDVGRITAVAVDPSDPSGNTVYVGGSGGGVWKTTDFLTNSSAGPTYIPLTDLGPTSSLNISSIALVPRNNDPDDTEVYATTGDGNVSSTGVGVLRSLDGGKSWVVLDSSTNFDSSGNPLPMNSTSRNHVFVGTTSFKIVADPNISADGNVTLYAAFSSGSTVTSTNTTGNGGIYRSVDSGATWTLMKAGQATDVLLDYNSKAAATGNVNIVYGAFQGAGVFESPNQGQTWNLMGGGVGNPSILNGDTTPNTPPIPVLNDSLSPNSGGGRIVLAKPAIVAGNTAENLGYEGWLYAAVSNADGSFNGLYVTKDFGQNWTKVRLPALTTSPGVPVFYAPTNDSTQGDYDVTDSTEARGGNYAISLAVDPTNANILYLGGTSDRKLPGPGLVRIDITKLFDPHAAVSYDFTGQDGGSLLNTSARVTTPSSPFDGPTITQPSVPTGSSAQQVFLTDQYLNLIRDPDSPLTSTSSIFVSNASNFTNTGMGATVQPFDAPIDPRNGLYEYTTGGADISDVGSNQHTIVTEVDPTTGLPRLILGSDQGVYTIVDQNGQIYRSSETDYEAAVDTAEEKLNPPNPFSSTVLNATPTDNGQTDATEPTDTSFAIQGSRNGNLDIAQLNYGAVDTDTLEAQLKDALVFGSGEGTGAGHSTGDVLTTGDTSWNTSSTDDFTKAVGVAVSQDTGPENSLGTVYAYYEPDSVDNPTDFFTVNGTPRTFQLIQSSQQGNVPDPQWPYASTQGGSGASALIGVDPTTLPMAPGNFTVNPLNGDQIVISSDGGGNASDGPHIFLTENQGLFWSAIAGPQDLDGTYAPTITFGAPNSTSSSANEDSYIFAGTLGGNIYVTFTGGGSSSGNAWTKMSGGLDGSPVLGIVADPVRGTHDAYAVTQKGVYYMADTTGNNPTWVNITGPVATDGVTPAAGNIFSVTKTLFGNATQTEAVASLLSSLAADWRYAIPNDPNNPAAGTHPVLYVGADSGVFRSLDQGQTWTLFPNQAVDGTPSTVGDGGGIPAVQVNDLDLAVGDITPTTGEPDVSTGPDLLVASTDGRGSYGIRVAPLVLSPGLQGGGTSTNTAQPTIVGTSEETAFGNTVTVNVYDDTNPASPQLIGTGTTDGSGKFAITLNPGFSTGGLRTVGVQAVDDAGTVGPMSTFKLTVNVVVPQISIASSVSHPEGNSGTTDFDFAVTLNQASTQTITVNYATADGSASAASGDYVAIPTTALVFPAGTTKEDIHVKVNGDTNVESDETFTVNLSSPSNATIANGMGTGTIVNDDSPPTINITTPTVTHNEGNSGQTEYDFNVALSSAQSQQVTVAFSTVDGSATVGNNDYVKVTNQLLTFAPGVTSATAKVFVIGDTNIEPTESFSILLSNPSSNATLGTAITATGTITNDDSPPVPTISITSPSQNEGNSGTSNMTFVVSLSAPSTQTVTVQYATADGTATAPSDYTAIPTKTLTFAPGVTQQNINVVIIGDTTVEANETFSLKLSNPSNATIATPSGTGTIINDDIAKGSITIANASMNEGNSGTSNMIFNVTLSPAQTGTVTVKYATADGTATTADKDYTSTTGTLTFAPGQTTGQIKVPIIGDTKVEANETFTVNLTTVTGNATVTTAKATGTIVNDDVPPPASKISINNVSHPEGNSGTTNFTFTVTLDHSQTSTVTVKYATADGTTTAGSDYTSKSGTLTFAAGVTSQTITVAVKGDKTVEPDEVFFVNLSGVVGNATISDPQGTGTIQNDDVPPSTGAVSVITDPTNSAKTALQIIGTANNDTISVTGADGNSTVTVNGKNLGTFKYTGSIIIYGQNGNDTISVASSITRTVYAFGGAGNDVINGGSGADLLQGGDGNDTVNGNNGDDILVGNDGTDILNGNAGNDVLIPGDFLDNPNFSVMGSLVSEWTRTDIGYSSKVSHMINGGGKNKIDLNPTTVFSSATLVDSVTGGSGQDFFVVAFPGDKITDLVSGETVENVGPTA